MSITTCIRCAALYEDSTDAADEPGWLGTRLCPACAHVERWHAGDDDRSPAAPLEPYGSASVRPEDV